MIESNRILQEIYQRTYKKQKKKNNKSEKVNSLRKNIMSHPTLNLPVIPFKVMNSQYSYFYSGFESAPRGYVCTCSKPLPIRQAISLEPEVVGRSVLARWIGLCLEWFGCQEPVRVRTFGSESRVRNRGAAAEHVIFCT